MNLEARVRQLEELVAVLSAGKMSTIETSCLRLVNDRGNVMGVLAASPTNSALMLTDPKSKASVTLGIVQGAPNIQLTRRDGSDAIQIADDGKDLTVFEMSGGKGKPRVSVAVTGDGPCLELQDQHGKCRLSMSLTKGGDPLVMLNNTEGQARMMLSVDEGPTKSASLVIRDSKGEMRCLLDIDDRGQDRFVLGGLNTSKIMIHVHPESGEIIFCDKDEQLRLGLGIGAQTGQPHLSLHNDQGLPRVTLGVTETHSGLAISDSHESQRVLAIVDSDERPWFIIRDDHQKDRLKMTIMPDGSSGVAIHDQQGQLVALLGGGSRNTASLTIKDATGRSQAILAFGPEGPALTMTDEAGQPIFTAP